MVEVLYHTIRSSAAYTERQLQNGTDRFLEQFERETAHSQTVKSGQLINLMTCSLGNRPSHPSNVICEHCWSSQPHMDDPSNGAWVHAPESPPRDRTLENDVWIHGPQFPPRIEGVYEHQTLDCKSSSNWRYNLRPRAGLYSTGRHSGFVPNQRLQSLPMKVKRREISLRLLTKFSISHVYKYLMVSDMPIPLDDVSLEH